MVNSFFQEQPLQKHAELTRQRLQQFAGPEGLRGLVFPRRAPVAIQVFAAPGRIPYAEALQGTYRPAQLGEVFGPQLVNPLVPRRDRYPAGWAGQEVHFLWDSSSEAKVWVDGHPVQGLTGSERAYGSRPEPLRPAYRLSHSAASGEHLTLYVEMACNRLFGIEGTPRFVLQQAKIAVFDREAWDLLWDFKVIADMASELPENTPRAGQALQAGNNMVNAFRLEDRATWAEGRQIAASFFSARNGDGQHNLTAVGYAHLDTAWLWPLAETRRKAVRTFTNTLRLMEDYPDYKFVNGQAQHLAWMKEQYPDLSASSRSACSAGSWLWQEAPGSSRTAIFLPVSPWSASSYTGSAPTARNSASPAPSFGTRMSLVIPPPCRRSSAGLGRVISSPRSFLEPVQQAGQPHFPMGRSGWRPGAYPFSPGRYLQLHG